MRNFVPKSLTPMIGDGVMHLASFLAHPIKGWSFLNGSRQVINPLKSIGMAPSPKTLHRIGMAARLMAILIPSQQNVRVKSYFIEPYNSVAVYSHKSKLEKEVAFHQSFLHFAIVVNEWSKTSFLPLTLYTFVADSMWTNHYFTNFTFAISLIGLGGGLLK